MLVVQDTSLRSASWTTVAGLAPVLHDGPSLRSGPSYSTGLASDCEKSLSNLSEIWLKNGILEIGSNRKYSC